MHLPGYYSSRDLNDNTGNGSWPLHHENKTYGQYYDLFLGKSTTIDYGYDKEELRQTMLKHESTFRHQLHELHRLYNIQRDMMNEIRSKELHQHLICSGTSQSSPFLSGILSEDEKKGWYHSKSPLVCLNWSTSDVDCVHSQFSTMKGNVLQSGCGSTQSRLRFKDSESLESKCKKLQRRLFDLELPADQYLNDEDEGQRVLRGSGVKINPFNGHYEVTRERAGNLSFYVGDAFSSNLYSRRTKGQTDLNEPIKVEEVSASAFVNIQDNLTWSKEGIQKWDLPSSSYSGFQCLVKEVSQEPHNGRHGGVSLSNLHMETERRQKGWLSNKFEAGQTGSNGSTFCGSFGPEDLYTPYKSPQIEAGNAHHNKTEPSKKRKIFGVDISERDQPVPQSSVVNSESCCVSSLKNFSRSSCQNLILLQGNPCSNTFPQSNNSSITWMQEVIQDKLLVNSDLRSAPSLGIEASLQNIPCCSKLMSKESQACNSSIGFGYSNVMSNSNCALDSFTQRGPASTFRPSGCVMVAKSAEDINVVKVPLSNFRYEVFSQPNLTSVDGPRKPENPCGILSWFRAGPQCDGKPSREEEDFSQMNLDSLQNYSKQSVDKPEKRKGPSESFIQDSLSVACVCDAEHGRTEVGDSLNDKNILGFPIFEKHQTPKDLPCSSFASSSPATAFDGGNNSGKVELLNTDLNHDPMPPRSGEQCQSKDLVLEKGLINQSADSRHLIDLNLCVEEKVEDESQPTLSSPKTISRTADIDLEVPVVVETGLGITSGGKSLESELKEPQDHSREAHEGLISNAAEALVSISLSNLHNLQGNALCAQLEASQYDPLHWFADVISSLKGDIDHEVQSVLIDKDNSACCEDLIADEIDYFEFMTLNLTESKVEEYNYKPQVFENPKDENTVRRRPRRGQARRGRQRKDFQRDILPTLTSLSRNEVTEDLLTIEGLIRADGGTWQSSLVRRNTAKSGRGRRCSGGSTSPCTAAVVCPPPIQQPCSREFGLEERSLTGWGKRTRRPPRQRCLIDNPPIPSK